MRALHFLKGNGGIATVDDRSVTLVRLPAVLAGLTSLEVGEDEFGALVGTCVVDGESRLLTAEELQAVSDLLGEFSAFGATVLVHAADAQGNYVGLVERHLAVQEVPAPPPATGTWIWSNGNWQSVPSLAEHKAARITTIKLEAVTRMSAILPGVDSVATVVTLRELYLSIAPAARAPTAKLTSIINIYQAADTAIGLVQVASTKEQVDSVVVNWPT